jgi:PAS domain S-box-containing protein
VGGYALSSEKKLSQEAEIYRNMYSLLRMMCNNAPDLIWAKDLAGRYLFANRAICDVLLQARDTDEPIGKTDLFFAARERDEHPENPEWHTFGEVCVDSDQVVLDSRKPGQFEEFGNVRGEFLRLDVHKAPFFDASGELIGTVGCGRDVTKEKELEKALQQCEDSCRLIAENTDDVIWTMDLATERCTYVSSSIEKLRGYTVEEVLQQTLDEMLTPESARYARNLLQHGVKAFAAGDNSHRVSRSEFAQTCKDGTVVPVEIVTTLLSDGTGRATTLLGVSRNISERKLAEAALRQSEERYRAILEQSPEAILLVDTAEYTIVEINPACCQLLGFERGELLGQSLWKCSMNDADTIELAQPCRLSPAGNNAPLACVYRHKTGVLIYVEQTGSIVELAGRKLFIASLRDVTAEHKRQQKINQELKLARDLQKATLREFPSAPGVMVQTIYEPVETISGDVYLLEWVVPGRIFRGYIADVIGHDIAAALVTSAMSVLLHEAAEMQVSLTEQLDWIHRRTLKSFPDDFFVAAIAFEVDLAANLLKYATAGINQFWHVRQGEVQRITAPSLFLSVTETADLCAGEIALQSGDLLYFPTDGLTDLMTSEQTSCFADFAQGVQWLESLAASPLRRDDATAICIRIGI